MASGFLCIGISLFVEGEQEERGLPAKKVELRVCLSFPQPTGHIAHSFGGFWHPRHSRLSASTTLC